MKIINVDKCIAGDHVALKLFYQQIAGPVLSVAFNILGDKALAEDVLHDVYIKSIANLEKWDKKSKINTWVYKIAINECLGFRRRCQRWLRIEKTLSEGAQSTAPVDYESMQIAENFLFSLNDKTRAIVVLKHVSGLSFDEISRVMSMPEGTVKSICSRALKREAKRLEKQ
jgi:RNA polymerase sigma-70 factor (ECF subfamily)